MAMYEITRRVAVFTILTSLLPVPAVLAQQPASPPQVQQPQQARPADPHAAEEVAAEKQALGFLQYLDQGRYADSYSYTSELIRSKMKDKEFANEIGKARAQEGAVADRKLLDASYTKTLPEVPAGRYVVLQYQTNFAVKKDRVETVTMSYEDGYWRVAGWHVDRLPAEPSTPPAGSQQPGQQPPQQGQPQEQPQQQPDQAPPQ